MLPGRILRGPRRPPLSPLVVPPGPLSQNVAGTDSTPLSAPTSAHALTSTKGWHDPCLLPKDVISVPKDVISEAGLRRPLFGLAIAHFRRKARHDAASRGAVPRHIAARSVSGS